MCRIAGIISKENQFVGDKNRVEEMCDVMQNGGPDDSDIFQSEDGKVTLGNNRLALIDISKNGSQPMSTPSGTVVTYNGEIYNYLEIKEELGKLNYQFQTESDTEVLLLAYECWKTDAFAKFRGMFAFCLYDPEIQQVFLVRDSSGIKPLYFSHQNNQLIFSSEVKAFLSSGIDFESLPEWKTYFLAFGHIPEPYTTLKNVESLPKGHFLNWNIQSVDYNIQQFHSFNYEEKIFSKEEAKKQINLAIKKSVKRHLISDAPVGVFLSGGIDSTILALLADENTRNLKNISVNFNEFSYSEEQFQAIVADKIIGEHVSHKLSESEFHSNMSQALNAMDQPTNDGLNTWYISKFAKDMGVKAVLSGIGADEYLGGYKSFSRGAILNLLNLLPPFMLKWISMIPLSSTRRCYFLSYKNFVGDYLFLRGIYDPKSISKILNVPIFEVNNVLNKLEINIPKEALKSYKTKVSWLEANMYLQNQLLKDADCMSMYHGVEVRTPYLDEDFIQTCLHVKSSIRFGKNQSKQLLVDAFKSILPLSIYNRKKMGFTFPLSKWLKNNSLIKNKEFYKSNSYSLNLLKEFQNNKLAWSKVLVLFQINSFNHFK